MLRRRWLWVVLGVLVGMTAGYVSTLLVKQKIDPNKYYKATNTIILNSGGATASANSAVTNAPNLSQVAFLVRSADVVEKVANSTGVTSDEVNDQISATARNDVLAIDVTAISLNNPDQAVALADSAAGVLTEYVANDQQKQFAKQRDDVLKKIDDLKKRRSDLEQKIASDPKNADVARAESDSIVNQLRLTYEELQGLATQGGPTGGFSTLQTAEPVQINSLGFLERLRANRDARGSQVLTQSTQPPKGDISETDLSLQTPPSRLTRTLIGGAAGLVLGLAAAVIIEAWDDRIRSRDRVEALTGLTVITEVPQLPKGLGRGDIAVVDAPRSRVAERYRAVRTAIQFALQDMTAEADESKVQWETGEAPVIMVTSPNPAEGKTTTIVNLAAEFADSGMRTLVIDGDYRKPSVARYLDPEESDEPGRPVATRLDGVTFIHAPRGSGSPGEAVSLLRHTVAQARKSVDVVLLDTPPMLTTNDATDLLAAADAVVLVLRSGQTRSGPAERVANVLARYRANSLGVVLNACDEAHIDSYYGYYRGYGYGEDKKSKNGNGSAKKKSAANAKNGRNSIANGSSGLMSRPEPSQSQSN